MENVILAIHLILALLLVGVVLLQRSEGGGLGMGGGGGGGVMSGRGAASALTRLTWILTAAFICTSVTLTILAAAGSSASSVTDQFGGDAPAAATETPLAPGTDLLPPAATDAPAEAPLPEE
ncbi:MAG: preprotein translocase subunit SecG [Paracoccaceae bacterium]